MPIRVMAAFSGWLEPGPGWHLLRQPLDSPDASQDRAGDCWLMESGNPAAFPVEEALRSGLPLVLAMAGDAGFEASLLDAADGFVLPGDDSAVVAAVFASAVAPLPAFGVRDLSDGTTRMI
ncbi:MAG: hypothetical protein ACOYLS_10690, partial [Polymorphobacter sp.]